MKKAQKMLHYLSFLNLGHELGAPNSASVRVLGIRDVLGKLILN